jgi:hypothetical protein
MSSEAYTRILTSLWSDNDFAALSADAQWLYFVILTAPDRSLCGVADWRVNRLKKRAVGRTAEALEIIADELEAAHFLVIDRDTEEALVRSFVRKDTVMKMPNMATAMVKAFQKVASPRLRAVIVHELQRLHREHPELKGWNEGSLELLGREALDVRGGRPPLYLAG